MRGSGWAWMAALALGCSGGADKGGKGAGDDDDATGTDGTSDSAPTTDPGPAPTIWINELMALNNTAYAVDGLYPDWIELWNPGAADVDLEGWFLTDDVSVPDKDELPAGLVVPAGGYLVLLADDDEELGPLHLNFKLSATLGEDVALFSPAGEQVDALEDLGIMPRDGALARIPDGGPTLEIVAGGTPGSSNGDGS